MKRKEEPMRHVNLTEYWEIENESVTGVLLRFSV